LKQLSTRYLSKTETNKTVHCVLEGRAAEKLKEVARDNTTEGFSLLRVKRIYEPPSKEDGFRILVDRLWPRGMSKQRAQLDLWLKEIAPSDELRQWFSHEPEKWREFKKKYRTELSAKKYLVDQIMELEKSKDALTLVYSARNTELNNAVALKMIIETQE